MDRQTAFKTRFIHHALMAQRWAFEYNTTCSSRHALALAAVGFKRVTAQRCKRSGGSGIQRILGLAPFKATRAGTSLSSSACVGPDAIAASSSLQTRLNAERAHLDIVTRLYFKLVNDHPFGLGRPLLAHWLVHALPRPTQCARVSFIRCQRCLTNCQIIAC